MKLRKSIRLKNYNYKTDGYYFITICSASKKPILSAYRDLIESVLKDLPSRFNGVSVDYHVIMPDHLHAIIVLNDSNKPIGEIVRTIKALVTKGSGRKPFWEWNYYEHVIRNEDALHIIRKYIQENPEKEKYEFAEIYKNLPARHRMNATATGKNGKS
jgi:REP element-mobilizing transposase RayT